MTGTLYICATPIGNMEDITLRVLRILSEVDFIAAEDTRHSLKILNHYNIKKKMVSYHEHNKMTKGNVVLARLLAGESCALVTDAGMPGISDPGFDMIKLCYENNVAVTVCPGASASITAVVLSGINSHRFCFDAFLPTDKKERGILLNSFINETRTIILYEAPHRLVETLTILSKFIQTDREVSVIREITKKHEQVIKNNITYLVDYFENNPVRGEFVIVIQGVNPDKIKQQSIDNWNEITIDEHMKIHTNKGLDEKSAMKIVAKERGVNKRDIYASLKIDNN